MQTGLSREMQDDEGFSKNQILKKGDERSISNCSVKFSDKLTQRLSRSRRLGQTLTFFLRYGIEFSKKIRLFCSLLFYVPWLRWLRAITFFTIIFLNFLHHRPMAEANAKELEGVLASHDNHAVDLHDCI